MRKLISLFLCVVLMVVAVPQTSLAVGAKDQSEPPAIPTEGDVWDGVTTTKPTKLVQKDGAYYYEISTCAELAYVAKNEGEWLKRNYILTSDLILNDTLLTWDAEGNCTNEPGTLHTWKPVGHAGVELTGIFDGRGHTISGMYIPDGGVCVGLIGQATRPSSIQNLHVVNSYVQGNSYVGGIVGESYSIVTNCTFSGMVKGVSGVGGIAGHCNTISCCSNSGVVIGGSYTGGIAGQHSSISQCANSGIVSGYQYVGGIVGQGSATNCYNAANITAENYCGGIAGDSSGLRNCYSIGITHCTSSTSNNYGAIVGSDGYIFSGYTATGCYYLQNSNGQFGCGNVADTTGVDPSGFYAKSFSELQQQSTFDGWDFTDTWAIDPSKNGGYPYLAWENPSNVPLTAISLESTSLSLGVGDTVYLTATPSPATANLGSLQWTSANENIATVSGNGRVTAISPGNTKIIVTSGSVSAECAVTVTGRTGQDYVLGNLTIRDSSGNSLSTIPTGSFWVSVPITKKVENGDAEILIAAYDTSGRFLQMLCADVSGLYQNQTITLRFYVSNNGSVARVKAFAISSLSDLTPLGASVEFPKLS